jgi:tetratricopeptide (TPR) repeat protein
VEPGEFEVPFLFKGLSTAVLTILLVITSAFCVAQSASSPVGKPAVNGYVRNEACAKCHAAIFESYKNSAMAHASGPAADKLIAGDFSHQASGVNYRIYSDAGKVWLSFDRPGDRAVHGKRELLYYIGQGRRGRSYLFSDDGFVFESPVNWYTDRHLWDMAPAYGNAREIPMTLPALTSCLDCHVSGIQPPINGTENRYKMPVFAYSGVTCERCHGPGAAHVNGGAIVNPTKLSADRRDQVCMQCHLEGNAAIERAGKHLYEYRPGADLRDYIHYYLLVDSHSPNLRAASQFEALAQSTCKKKSGDAMSCTSCHDPHRSIPAEERVTFYRAKCLACHGVAFGAKHHADQPDCAHCHMPAALSSDVAHTEVTDHRIPRRPTTGPKLDNAGPPVSPQLVTFPNSKDTEHDVRDLSLAWQSIVNSGMTVEQPQAEKLLRQAAIQFPDDPAVLSALGYVEQTKGASDRARELYRKALALDPNLIDAATNLGVLEAQSGHLPDAVKLWQGAFQRAPGRSSIGMNLARAFCAARQTKDARSYTLRVLEFNPDLTAAKKLLSGLDADPPTCAP